MGASSMLDDTVAGSTRRLDRVQAKAQHERTQSSLRGRACMHVWGRTYIADQL